VAAMTGSGSAVFGLFADDEAASRARSRLLAGDESSPAGDADVAAGSAVMPPLADGRVFCVTDLQLPAEEGRGGASPPGAGPRPDAGHEGARTPGSQSARRGRPSAPPRRAGPGRRRPPGR